jgi:hypothetical protein
MSIRQRRPRVLLALNPGYTCFERTLAYVTGLANVRDAIPFPRTPGNARY